MTDVPDYARGVDQSIHEFPGQTAGSAPDPNLMKPLFTNLIEVVLRKVVLSIIGTVLPGPAGQQLSAWASKIFDAFDGIDLSSPGGILRAIVDGLRNLNPSDIPLIGGLIGSFFDALQGGTPDLSTPSLLTELTNALKRIPFVNILGIGGPGNIGDSLQSTWDQSVGGAVGTPGSGSGLADVFNVFREMSSRATLGQYSFDILGIRGNKSMLRGFFPTSNSTVSIDRVALQSSAPTFGVTQSTAITGYQRIDESGQIGFVSWLGSGVASVTDAFVNIWKMDPSTGLSTLAHGSSSVLGLLSSSMQHNVYTLPSAIDVEPGDVYGFEVAVRGAGTHNIVGMPTWLPDHPSVFPRRLSSVRNSGTSSPPSTIAHSSLTYATNVPVFEFGPSTGVVALPRTPDLQQFQSSTTVPVPSWANVVQVVQIPAAGGGHQGGTWGVGGAGGSAGAWATTTWTRGVDFDAASTPILNIVVGAGGSAGAGNGGNGGNSVTTLPATTGHSSQALTSIGGAGATSFDILGNQHSGRGPGDTSYDSVPYVGGLQQDTYGAKGNSPGGAGAGGNWVSFQFGGTGAPGSTWIRFKQ